MISEMRLLDRVMLRIYIREEDVWEEQPLYEVIVKRAAQLEIAGATVHADILGYGRHHHVHRHKTFESWRDDPVTIIIVDTREKVIALIGALRPMLNGRGMLVISDVTRVEYADEPVDKDSG